MPDLREALAAAYEKHDGDELESPADTVGNSDAGEAGPDATGDGETQQATDTTEDSPDTQAESTDESRPGKPKFLPAEESEGEDSEEADTAEAEPAPVEPTTRAPVSWRAAAKEHWEQLPDPVRQEVDRREREMGRVTREAAQARQFNDQFNEVIGPFRGLIEADRSDPLTATRFLFQTAAGLRTGTPQQKAAIVADVIQRYGIDIGTLDSMLVGETPAGNGAGGVDQNQIAQMIDQRLAPVNQLMSTVQQAQNAQRAQLNQTVDQEIDTFAADSKNVFFEDVRETMANLLDVAARQGQEMSLKQAYDTAVAMNPELAQMAVRQQQAAQAKTQQQSLQKKKRAAASVRGSQQVPNASAPPKDMRSQLEAAWEAQGGGG